MKVLASSTDLRTRGLSSVSASIVSALALLAIFRLTVTIAGVATLGVWALLQGLFIVTRIADSGVGANVTKHAAVLIREHRAWSAWRLLASASVLGTAPVAGLCLVTFWPILWYVSHRYSNSVPDTQIVAMAITAVIFGILSSFSTISLSVCEGSGRLTAKNNVLIASNLLALGSAYPLISTWKGLGVGLTYSVMAITQMVLALALLSRLKSHKAANLEPEGIREGARLLWRQNAQLMSVATFRLTFEPATKLFLSLTGGLAIIAAFELALRVSTQVRVLVQAGAQPLLFLGARRDFEASPEVLRKFLKADDFIRHLVVFLTAIQLVSAAGLSLVGLGYVDSNFLIFFGILAIANSANASGMAGYYLQLSSGDLRPLVKIHFVMAVINMIGGSAALLVSSTAVVAAYAMTLTYGGIALMRIFMIASQRTWGSYIMDVTGSRLVMLGILSGSLICLAYLSPGIRESNVQILILSCASALAVGSFAGTYAFRALRRLD